MNISVKQDAHGLGHSGEMQAPRGLSQNPAPPRALEVVDASIQATKGTQGLRPLKRLAFPGNVILSLIFLIIALAIAYPGLFTSHDPLMGKSAEKLLPPSYAHLFGTDYLGRDLLSRVIYGAPLTLVAAGLSVPIGLIFGVLFGLLAAGLRGAVDTVIMRLIDILLSIPGFLLALCLVSALGPSTITLAVAVGISSIAVFTRLMRSEVLRVGEFDFVEAAYLSGHGPLRTMFHDILPNSLGPVLALAPIEMSHSILTISALAFLGYGNPPPSPEWGVLLAEGRNFLGSAWWITTMPGLALIVVAVAFAALSKKLQDAGRI